MQSGINEGRDLFASVNVRPKKSAIKLNKKQQQDNILKNQAKILENVQDAIYDYNVDGSKGDKTKWKLLKDMGYKSWQWDDFVKDSLKPKVRTKKVTVKREPKRVTGKTTISTHQPQNISVKKTLKIDPEYEAHLKMFKQCQKFVTEYESNLQKFLNCNKFIADFQVKYGDH